MHFTVTDLRSIASAGGGLVMRAGSFTATDLRSIASAIQSGGGQMTLSGLNHFTATDLRSIASAGGGRVVFDFS